MYLENVNLPYYTEKEDKANSISHLVGVVFGAVATVVLLMRSNDISHIISSIIFGVAMIILYSGFITDFPREKRKRLQDLLTILSFLF